MQEFNIETLKQLYSPAKNSNGEDNGQITIIGGSDLFHGAPILALKAASKIVDMVFFASPEVYFKDVATYLKSEVSSFIWIPWEEVDKYIEKSDAVLIGPGFKRYSKEGLIEEDEAYLKTRNITENLLKNHKNKKWVIDAGSLQTMDADWIPANACLTPNKKEFEILFADLPVEEASKKYNCNIALKSTETKVCSADKCVLVKGGNAGLTKGGTGDVLAGLTTALLAKNDPFLALTVANYVVKKAAEDLAEDVGVYFSADDLTLQIPVTLAKLLK